jgi:hypothetical protein
MTQQIKDGFAAPYDYEFGSQNSSKTSDRIAATKAYQKKIGIYDPDNAAALLAEGFKTFVPSAADKAASDADTANKIGNLAGVGLVATGKLGAFKALGEAGTPTAQTWNAIMAGLGVAQNILQGTKNKGADYPIPTIPSAKQSAAGATSQADRDAITADFIARAKKLKK